MSSFTQRPSATRRSAKVSNPSLPHELEKEFETASVLEAITEVHDGVTSVGVFKEGLSSVVEVRGTEEAEDEEEDIVLGLHQDLQQENRKVYWGHCKQ